MYGSLHISESITRLSVAGVVLWLSLSAGLATVVGVAAWSAGHATGTRYSPAVVRQLEGQAYVRGLAAGSERTGRAGPPAHASTRSARRLRARLLGGLPGRAARGALGRGLPVWVGWTGGEGVWPAPETGAGRAVELRPWGSTCCRSGPMGRGDGRPGLRGLLHRGPLGVQMSASAFLPGDAAFDLAKHHGGARAARGVRRGLLDRCTSG